MNNNPLPLPKFADLINLLMTEATPVLAVLFCPDGSKAKLYGFVDSATSDGLVISAARGTPSVSSTIQVLIGEPAGSGCEAFLGTADDLPDDRRDNLAMHFGDTALFVVLPSKTTLMISFTQPKTG
jgi:hypothetical protein